jgi:aminoglycoside N3'-acetyltransferase
MHRNNYESYYGVRSLEKIENKSKDYLLVIDNTYRNFMKQENKRGDLLQTLYDNTTSVVTIKSGKIISYTSKDPKVTDIRTSWNTSFTN